MTHGKWCGARTFPTRCRYCGQSVFYFSCNCGSKVFFDELGVWRIHRCSGWLKVDTTSFIVSTEKFFGRKLPYNQQLHDYNQSIRDRILPEQKIEVVEEYVEQSYVKKVQVAANVTREESNHAKLEREKRNHPILGESAYKNARTSEDGIIREIIPEINIFKKLKLEKTSISQNTLGELASVPWAQITIHTGALGDDDNSSFTFLVKLKVVKQKALAIGDFVSCQLLGYQILGRDPIWICKELKSAFE